MYHWYNIPASPDRKHWDNPLNHLRAVAKKEDYVLFKLDIDMNTVEEAMVHYLLDSPELLELIDDFFWEHHVNFEPMARWWGLSQDNSRNMTDSLALFTALRRAGVRAHSWT